MTFVDSLMENVTAKLQAPSTEPELKFDARDRLKEVRSDARLISSENGYENFLLEYVQKEYQKFTDDKRERSDPLCTCSNSQCDLKVGRVPLDVRNADSVSQGIRMFEQTHTGRPVVLHDARREWARKVDRVEEELMTISVHLTHGIPFEDDE